MTGWVAGLISSVETSDCGCRAPREQHAQLRPPQLEYPDATNRLRPTPHSPADRVASNVKPPGRYNFIAESLVCTLDIAPVHEASEAIRSS